MESQRTTMITAFNRNSKLTRKEIELLAQCASELESKFEHVYRCNVERNMENALKDASWTTLESMRNTLKDASWTTLESMREIFGSARVLIVVAASVLQYEHSEIYAKWADDIFSYFGVASSAADIQTVSPSTKDGILKMADLFMDRFASLCDWREFDKWQPEEYKRLYIMADEYYEAVEKSEETENDILKDIAEKIIRQKAKLFHEEFKNVPFIIQMAAHVMFDEFGLDVIY